MPALFLEAGTAGFLACIAADQCLTTSEAGCLIRIQYILLPVCFITFFQIIMFFALALHKSILIFSKVLLKSLLYNLSIGENQCVVVVSSYLLTYLYFI